MLDRQGLGLELDNTSLYLVFVKEGKYALVNLDKPIENNEIDISGDYWGIDRRTNLQKLEYTEALVKIATSSCFQDRLGCAVSCNCNTGEEINGVTLDSLFERVTIKSRTDTDMYLVRGNQEIYISEQIGLASVLGCDSTEVGLDNLMSNVRVSGFISPMTNSDGSIEGCINARIEMYRQPLDEDDNTEIIVMRDKRKMSSYEIEGEQGTEDLQEQESLQESEGKYELEEAFRINLGRLISLKACTCGFHIDNSKNVKITVGSDPATSTTKSKKRFYRGSCRTPVMSNELTRIGVFIGSDIVNLWVCIDDYGRVHKVDLFWTDKNEDVQVIIENKTLGQRMVYEIFNNDTYDSEPDTEIGGWVVHEVISKDPDEISAYIRLDRKENGLNV